MNAHDAPNAGKVPLQAAALFVDFDGTLAPIAPTPSAVRPHPERTALLQRAQLGMKGRLAVVSGRPVSEIDRLIGGAVPCVAGVHGLERRDAAGELHVTAAHPGLADVGAVIEDFAWSRPGLLVESKDTSVALHFRGAPGAEGAVTELVRRLADATGLGVQRGKMMMELRTPGPHKGDTVRAYMSEPPFRGATPIYIGDDATDEAGFDVVESLGGFGVVVGRHGPTRARYRLTSQPFVMDWISESLRGGAFDPGDLLWAA